MGRTADNQYVLESLHDIDLLSPVFRVVSGIRSVFSFRALVDRIELRFIQTRYFYPLYTCIIDPTDASENRRVSDIFVRDIPRRASVFLRPVGITNHTA
jgi:hypothetical protein